MDKLETLIERYGLSEDEEYVIIPYTGPEGRKKRIFLLRRPHLIIRRGPDRHMTVPLEEIVHALVEKPEESIWETLDLDERLRLAERGERMDDEAPRGLPGDHLGGAPSEASGREGSSQDADTGAARPSSTTTLPEKG